MIALNKVLVPIDFEEASNAALIYARNLTKAFNGQLHILHVMDNIFLRAMANDPSAIEAGVVRQLEEHVTDDDRQTLHAVIAVRKSDAPAVEIVRYAKDEGINLIVMGTHGRQNVAHLLMGSVAEKVVRTAPCPVMTVRHPEHEFVVPDTPEARHDLA